MGKGPEQAFLRRRHPHGRGVHEMVLSVPQHQGNEIKATVRHQLPPLRIALIQTTRYNKIGHNGENTDPLCTTGGSVNWCSRCGRPDGVSSNN